MRNFSSLAHTLATKPDDLNVIPGVQVVEEENQLECESDLNRSL